MPTAAVNGQSISYEDTGGDGPVLLFSHGFMMDGTMFDPQVEALAADPAGYRCIRWDERGFGNTPCTGSFTYWDSADDAVALLDHLGVDRAVWLGMSQGGFLSLRAALAHPERVRALVLMDTQAGPEDPEAAANDEMMVGMWEAGTDEEVAAVAQVVADLIIGDSPVAKEWIDKWLPRDRTGVRLPMECLLGRDDITDRLGEIGVPALVIHGTEDAAITMDKAEALCAGLSGCQGLVKVEGAAHAANLTHPDQVNPPMIEFLRSLPA